MLSLHPDAETIVKMLVINQENANLIPLTVCSLGVIAINLMLVYWVHSEKLPLGSKPLPEQNLMLQWLMGNKLVDHSYIVGASPVDFALTTSSFSTENLAWMD